MNNDIGITKIALDAFPVLSNATFVRRLAPPIPLVPDTTFDIFATSSQDFFALVATDYADPQHQSLELKNISGQYGFEFVNLLKPYSQDNDTIEILEHDDMEDDFLVHGAYKNYKLYYYLANLKVQLDN